METQFLNYKFMKEAFLKILVALPVTLNIAIVSMILAFILSFFIAMVRINKIPVLTKLAAVYVSFIRGTPLLVQIYLSYYGIPKFLDYMHTNYNWNLDVNNIPAGLSTLFRTIFIRSFFYILQVFYNLVIHEYECYCTNSHNQINLFLALQNF